MKRLLILVTALLSAAYLSASVSAGSKVFSFTASDPDGKIINSDSIKGFVAVGFYEGRESSTKNNRLKDALKDFYNSGIQSGNNDLISSFFKLSIVDGTPANLATKWVWKRKIKTKAAENSVDIYIDWDGNVKRAFDISGDDSTFIIIDKVGTVRYIRSGVIPESEFNEIFSLLKKLRK